MGWGWLGLPQWLSRSWWVLLFVALSLVAHLQAMKSKHRTLSELQAKCLQFEQQKASAEQEREQLLLQLNSQKDPEWIRMTLMKRLGLVPEGQVKVYFKSEGE